MNIHRNRHICPGIALCIALMGLAGGCEAPKAKYIPQTIGMADTGESANGIEVMIEPATDRIILGRPLVFNVTIKNAGTDSYWMAKDPQLVFVWVYPNGQRDNVVQELPPRYHYSKKSAMLLGPGATITKTVTVRTHYFPEPGITEFRAIMHAAENTNPSLQPFWHGKALSNAYGVLVQKPGFRT